VPRKGRARRFREARQLKQGLADRSIEDLLDSNWETVSEDQFEDEYDEDDEDDDEYEDEDEDDDDEEYEDEEPGWAPPPPPPLKSS
jgi:hypothetical protein